MSSPKVINSHGPKWKLPSRKAKIPAMAAEMKVMIRTADRVAISHLETTSRLLHSSLLTRGITRNALPHIETFTLPTSHFSLQCRPPGGLSCPTTESRSLQTSGLLSQSQLFI